MIPRVAPRHPHTPLEARYRKLKDERGPKTPRGWAPGDIASEFCESVALLEKVLVGDGPFYPDGTRALLPEPSAVSARGSLAGGDELASLLAARPRFRVDRQPRLAFHYVDREIVPTRAEDAKGRGTYQASPLSLDLLLVNADDRTPIVAEAKLSTDPKDPEGALLQALTYATMVAPAPQRERLPTQYPDLFRSGTPERVDVYVILYKLPKSREKLLDSAATLAAGLSDSGVGKYVRRIAFLEAYLRNGRLRFRRSRPLVSFA